MPSGPFYCSVCRLEYEVRLLRNSVCPSCVGKREQLEAQAKEMAARAELRRRHEDLVYELLLEGEPVYEGALEDWVEGYPVMLPGLKTFICARCRKARSVKTDLKYLRNKNFYATPRPAPYNTVCDSCYLDNAHVMKDIRERTRAASRNPQDPFDD